MPIEQLFSSLLPLTTYSLLFLPSVPMADFFTTTSVINKAACAIKASADARVPDEDRLIECAPIPALTGLRFRRRSFSF